MDICSNPQTKGDHLLRLDDVATGGGAAAGRQQHAGRKSTPVLLVVTAAIAVAALIMAAWATWKAQDIAKLLNAQASTAASISTVALVSNPRQAIANGKTVLGSLYRGSGYWDDCIGLHSQFNFKARSDHAAVSYQGNIYLIGGNWLNPDNVSEFIVRDSFTEYNMNLNTASELEPMPEPRYRFGCAVLGDKLYVFGGFNEIETNTTLQAATTLIYSFTTKKWDDPKLQGTPKMNFPRADIWGAAVDGKVYALGGYNITDNYNAVAYGEALDTTTMKWSPIANMMVARGDLSVNVANGRLYAMGGVTNIGDGSCPGWHSCHPWVASVEVYDPKSNTWTLKASMNWARGDFATGVLSNGNIIAAGGEAGYTNNYNTSRKNQVPQRWVEEYVTELDYWVLKAAMSTPRYRFDLATPDGNFLYAFGGASNCDEDSTDTDQGVCTNQLAVLNTISGFFDNGYPNIWVATA